MKFRLILQPSLLPLRYESVMQSTHIFPQWLPLLLLVGFLYIPEIRAQQSPVFQQLNYSLHSSPHHPKQVAGEVQAYLSRRLPITKRGSSHLRLVHSIGSPGGRYYTFQQVVQGMAVYRTYAKAHVSPQGLLTTCISQLAPVSPTQHPASFSISAETLTHYFQKQDTIDNVDITPYYYWSQQVLIPIYQAIVQGARSSTAWEILIDARTGQEFHREDRAVYYQNPLYADTVGRARVFLPDPCTRGEVGYGDLFVDDNDSHAPIFESVIDTVILQGLTYENGVFHLRGPYVSIEDIDPNEIAPATSVNGDFFYTRDQSGFEDVMAYYHIDSMQRYVQQLGFMNLQNRPFRVDPHGFGNADKSSFLPNGEFSYLKFGEGGVDDAEDADVLIHEYAHALSYAAAPETNFGFERRSLDEGYGDYFAAGYSFDINPFRWEEVFNWDGHNPFFPGRTARSSLMYPPTSTSIYTWGEIWASMLMEIRNDIGGKETDRLVLQAMYGSVGNMSFMDATQLLLEADTLLYDGSYSEIISFYACQRGILEGGNCLSVDLPEGLSGSVSWHITSPTPNNFQIVFPQASSTQAPYTLHITNLIGQQIWLKTYQAGESIDFQLPQTSGIYVVHLEQSGIPLGVQKWIQP